jgi:hypothetical protein
MLFSQGSGHPRVEDLGRNYITEDPFPSGYEKRGTAESTMDYLGFL